MGIASTIEIQEVTVVNINITNVDRVMPGRLVFQNHDMFDQP